MDPQAYAQMADTEARHWWFVARKDILRRMIGTLKLPEGARILEVGSGTGGNLEMLSRFGNVSALEMDEGARKVARDKTGGRFSIFPGHCPDDIPFKDERFDLVCMFDVLEHIDEDVETLSALRGLLAPGGRMLVTVPAYRWLWGSHDVFLHHKRRYTAGSLRRTLRAGGLAVDRLTYFNTLLLPLVAGARLLDKALGRKEATGGDIPSPATNRVLCSIFRSERRLLPAVNFPAGVSLLAVARLS